MLEVSRCLQGYRAVDVSNLCQGGLWGTVVDVSNLAPCKAHPSGSLGACGSAAKAIKTIPERLGVESLWVPSDRPVDGMGTKRCATQSCAGVFFGLWTATSPTGSNAQWQGRLDPRPLSMERLIGLPVDVKPWAG